MAATQFLSGTDKTNRNKRVEMREIFLSRSVNIYSGTAVTRAAVRALVGDGPPNRFNVYRRRGRGNDQTPCVYQNSQRSRRR